MNDFFVAGGTLRHDSPSYVNRPADEQLLQATLAGSYCYILTPRQMGKSSLMVRTARRLQAEGVRTAVIDLTAIGTAVTAEQWYLGLITRLCSQLRLRLTPQTWWQERAALGVVQRFSTFLHDCLLAQIKAPIVLLIDEIDTTLNLPFSDDFFAAVRALYNARATDPIYNRLTFVFLGVAVPADLIKDPQRTPFNIGQGIDLQEFSQADAAILAKQLTAVYPQQGPHLFQRIYHWTNGHPYLTQRLCLTLAEAKHPQPTSTLVDETVATLFLSKQTRGEDNIQFVSTRLLNHPQKRALLGLYKQIYQGKTVPDDRKSWLQSQLKLTGLVKTGGNQLEIRNPIYRHSFDAAWIRHHTTVSRPLLIIVATLCLSLVALSLLLYDNFFLPRQARTQEQNFRQAVAIPTNAAALEQLLSLQPLLRNEQIYRYTAYDLFFTLPNRQSQEEIFATVNEADALTRLVTALHVTLADVSGTDQTRPLLEAMSQALRQFPQEETAVQLQQEIDNWLEARTFLYAGADNQALEAYNAALALNPQNPALLFERAAIYTRQGRFTSATQDLEQLLIITADEAGNNITLPTRTPTPPPTIGPHATSPFSGLTDSRDVTRMVEMVQATTIATIQPPTPTPTPGLTPGPTPANTTIPAQFATRSQRIDAIRRLMARNPALTDTLAHTQANAYPNLTLAGLIPNLTSRRLYLPLDEPGDISQWSDQSGYNHDALCNNDSCPIEITGPLNLARRFDGLNDYLTLGRRPDLESLAELTLAAWIRPTANDGLRNIISKGYTRTPDGEIVLRIFDGHYQVGSWDGSDYQASYPMPVEDMNRWVHLAGVYDGQLWYLYRDGILVSQTTDPTPPIFVNAGWAIGSRYDGSERFFAGDIDEILIYNRALSPAEILSFYNQ